jgi:hypothetical protein
MHKTCVQPVQNSSKTWLQTRLLVNSKINKASRLSTNPQVVPSQAGSLPQLCTQATTTIPHLLTSYLSTLSPGLTKTTTIYINRYIVSMGTV